MTSVFFACLFILGLVIGKGFRLGYADTTTLIFTTTARNSEVVIGVAVSLFPSRPLVYFAMLLGPMVELPILLLFGWVMLTLREQWRWGSRLPTAVEE